MIYTIKVQENNEVVEIGLSDGTSRTYTDCYKQQDSSLKCYNSDYTTTAGEGLLFAFCLLMLVGFGYVIGKITSN